MARTMAAAIGHEVLLERTNLALPRRAAARLAGVSPQTQDRVEQGDPTIGLDTACRVAAAVGLKLWAKAYPVTSPSLRDTGQLRIAEWVREVAHPAYRVSFEVALADGRSADALVMSPTEIIHAEIERRLADWQGQSRRAIAKRDELATRHQRPVRLVMVVEDTERNRAAVREHAGVIGSMFPAGSREILRALRTGEPLGRDGILWVRPRDIR